MDTLFVDQSHRSTYNLNTSWAKTSMAAGVAQFWCELCNRLKLTKPEVEKQRLGKMSSTVHLILASLAGIAVALLATYLPSIYLRGSRRSLEPGFNLILAPENLPDRGRIGWNFPQNEMFRLE